MSLRSLLASQWTRRQMLQASAGIAACSLARNGVGADTSVPAEFPCVDMPIIPTEVPSSAVARISVAAAASFPIDASTATRLPPDLSAHAQAAPVDAASQAPTEPS